MRNLWLQVQRRNRLMLQSSSEDFNPKLDWICCVQQRRSAGAFFETLRKGIREEWGKQTMREEESYKMYKQTRRRF